MKIEIAVSLMVGLGIGAFYFFGLWWTVRRLPAMRTPALWTFGSFMVRTAVCVVVFYLTMQGRWENLLICLAGFTLARLWLVRRLKPA
jgi:F1F0 ATPase subunit 2